jgi:hypothetical protein
MVGGNPWPLSYKMIYIYSIYIYLSIYTLFIYLYIYMYYVLDSSEKLKTCYFSEGYSIAVHQVISDEECCALVRGPSHWGFTPSENDRTVSLPGWGMYTYIYMVSKGNHPQMALIQLNIKYYKFTQIYADIWLKCHSIFVWSFATCFCYFPFRRLFFVQTCTN